MGQAASRRVPEHPPIASSSSSPSPADEPTTTKRSSFRRSFVNAFKPHTDGGSPTPREKGSREPKGLRRIWRSSRRWSRTPPPPSDEGPRDSSPEQGSPSTLPESPSAGQASQIPEPSALTATEPQPDTPPSVVDISSAAENPVHVQSEQVPQPEIATSEPTDLPETVSDELPPPLAPPTDNDAPMPSLSTPREPPPTTPTPSQPPARQFPPPGTLVVVQGVVHTSDTIPSPSAPGPEVPSAIPERGNDPGDSGPPVAGSRPSTPAGSERTRSRLSSLLRPRPPSSIHSRPPSSVLGDNASSPTVPSFPSLTQSSTTNTTDTATSTTDEASPVPPEHPQTPPVPPTAQHPQTISSSSIDVLGTLLSVAAAATAASLLTGSSEPMAHTRLSPPNPHVGNVPLFTRPHAAATGATDFMDPHFHPDPNMSRVERVRNVWGSFRERFGLRGSPTWPLGSEHDGVDTRVQPDGTPLDPREMMLAEMARAFNAGLGLSGPAEEASNMASASSHLPHINPNQALPPVPLPPEGSFERFLVDLQVDLRAALTQPSDATPPLTSHPNDSVYTEPQAVDLLPSRLTSRAPSPFPSQSVPVEDDDDDEPPPLEDVSDSSDSDIDTEFMNDMDDDPDDEVQPSGGEEARPTPSIGFPGETSQPPPIHPLDSQPNLPERINWWRFYRFPAIPAPRAQTLLNRSSTSPPAPGPIHVPSSPPVNSPAPSSPNPSEPSSPSPTATTPSREGQGVVIPVIVVGLQSVHSTQWHHIHTPEPPPPNLTDDLEASVLRDESPLSHVQEPDPHIPYGAAAADPLNRNARGRSWHARAANVLRNLRPSRRSPSPAATRLPDDSAGSRTFMIYVIGGYYPPDHHIVTQTFTDFESFEALLELADLLGQVKPPTVSKEEIDKSGLQIIQMTQLQEFEREGKISSNCIERCLVCLDDYAPEDEIRVMNCKHAFHKNCVDRWLQTGRNNCPACRSKGISTEDRAAPTSSA